MRSVICAKETWVAVLLATTSLLATPAEPVVAQSSFERGDTNADEVVDLTDAIFTLRRLFIEDEPIACPDASDVNDDGGLNVSDAVYLLRYLFQGGAAPVAPFGTCGLDLSEDNIGCAEHGPCAVVGDLCLSEELLADTLGPIDGFSFCLPAGVLEIPLEGFAVSVCPEDEAGPCDELGGAAGCSIELTSVTPFVDFDRPAVGLRLEGRIEDFPIDVTESLFGSTTTCDLDVGGSEEGSPFAIDIVIPLIVRKMADGTLEITGVEEGSVEIADLELAADGGIVCVAFSLAGDLFVELLLAPLDQALAELTASLSESVVGLQICK